MSRLNMPLDDPFWDVLDDYFYTRIVVGKKRINKTLLKRVVAESREYNDRAYMPREMSPQDTYLDAFVKVALFYRAKEFLKLIDDASEDIMIPFIRNASHIEYIHLALNDEAILNSCKRFLTSYTYRITGQTLFIPAVKSFLGLILSQEEIDFTKQQAQELRNERPFFWDKRDGVHQYALLSLATPSEFGYKKLRNILEENFAGCTELDLCTLLFRDYALMLTKQKHIDAIVRDYANLYMPLLQLGMRYQSGRHLIKAESGIWARIFSSAETDVLNLSKLRTIISNIPDNGIDNIDFLTILKKNNEHIYSIIISEQYLDCQSKELDNWDTDFSSYVDRSFELSYLYSDINADKSLSYIFDGINQGTLRHGWRKDTLVCYGLTETLEVMLDNNFISCQDSRDIIQEVFNLTVKARDITDGKYTWKGPYEVIRIVSNYDVDLAAEFYSQYANKNEMANIAKLFLVKAKIGLGYSADDILKEIGRFTKRSYADTIDNDYYEQCFAAYIYLAAKELYSSRHRRQAFNKARSCIEALNDNSSYFRGNDFDDEIKKYEELCLKYNVESNIRQAKDNDVKPEEKLSEADFVVKLNRIKSSSGLENIFKILFNRNIDITKKETWELLINKTESIDSSIDRMLAYFKHLYYPSASYWSSNSHSAYYALAALLRKPDHQSELFNYLKDHCGHDSYSELIKAYSANNDKNNSILLFNRFVKICHLLVD